MGLKTAIRRWFDEWIQEWLDRELDARINTQIQAWADACLDERIEATSKALTTTWDKSRPTDDFDIQLTKKVNESLAEKFDLRFFTWADTWARKNLTPLLDEHFDKRFDRELDIRVQARIANRVGDQIDRRIRQWLMATRPPDGEHQEPSAASPSPEGAEISRPPEPAESPAATMVTAAELSMLLKRSAIGDRQVKRVLTKKMTGVGRPPRYQLGEAASWILLRNKVISMPPRKRRGRKQGQD